jgi:hypothetical protein
MGMDRRARQATPARVRRIRIIFTALEMQNGSADTGPGHSPMQRTIFSTGQDAFFYQLRDKIAGFQKVMLV